MNDAAYDELYVYTMGRRNFILQHVVDAYMAQTTNENSGIGIVFALVGLYLHMEKGFTGTQVQQVHQQLARRKRQWPAIQLPTDRGSMNASDVMAIAAGDERDLAIDRWCRSVWNAFAANRDTVVRLVEETTQI